MQERHYAVVGADGLGLFGGETDDFGGCLGMRAEVVLIKCRKRLVRGVCAALTPEVQIGQIDLYAGQALELLDHGGRNPVVCQQPRGGIPPLM